MPKRAIEGFQLSPRQERVWRLQGQDTFYCVQTAFLLDGELNLDNLKDAARSFVDSHEILRTRYVRAPEIEMPLQIAQADLYPGFDEISQPRFQNGDMEAAIQEILAAQRRLVFASDLGPPVRLAYVELSDKSHLLIVTASALSADIITLRLLIDHLGGSSLSAIGDAKYSQPPIQYKQFAEWQNQLLNGEEAEAAHAYWTEQAACPAFSARLHFQKEAEVKGPFQPMQIRHNIRGPGIARMRETARLCNVSIHVFLIACWRILLQRMAAQPDVILGHGWDGRDIDVLQNAAGLFFKYLPLSMNIDEESRFDATLTRIDEAVAESTRWGDYFRLNDSGGPPSRTSNCDYFPFSFEFVEWPEASGLGARICLYSCLDRFDLKLLCETSSDSIKLAFYYDPRRFYEADVARVASYYDALVADAVRFPSKQLSDLRILNDSDIQELIRTSAPATLRHNGLCLHEIFELQADLISDRIAIAYRDEQLSYGELNRRANQLAHYLITAGVEAEQLVGLCLERSVETMIGILGIFKAGAAYLPIDHSYPDDRLKFIVEDARLSAVLTVSNHEARDFCKHLKVIRLDTDWERIAAQSGRNPGKRTQDANLAYVIYTSGSTGSPKGVMIQHRSAVNLYEALKEAIYGNVAGNIRIGLNAPLTFDASVKQWIQLLDGRLLHILPEEARLDGARLLSYLQRRQIEVLDTTPSQLSLLLETGFELREKGFPFLILIGGEAVDGSLWKRLATAISSFNVYGPTECTVDATIFEIKEGSDCGTIGRPLRNTQAYLLDHRLTPVAIGQAGELFLGGEGVARGYLHRPDLTGEKFLPNGFVGRPGRRMYKTGDLAVYSSDRNIKFLGRQDYQVKLRGYRIELGEIEAILRQHPAISDAAVIMQEDRPGDKRLAAYVSVASRRPVNVDDARTFLKDRLPDHMVPPSIIMLDKLPITRNGKVDRKALSSIKKGDRAVAAEIVSPSGELEHAIAAIWQEVLNVEKVGVKNNFFDLGGHSLLMVQLHRKLHESLGLEISMLELFSNPTVEMQARFAANRRANDISLESIRDAVAVRRDAMNRRADLTKKRNKLL